MKRSHTVRAIFWELRAAGAEGSAKDVLRLAYFLLRSHQGEIARADDFGRVVDSRALPMLPVDVVMGNAGWRVVEFENSRASNNDFDPSEIFARERRIERFVGRLCPRSTFPD